MEGLPAGPGALLRLWAEAWGRDVPARAVPGPDGRHREHRPAPPTRDQRRWALHCLGTRWPVSRRRAPRRPEARVARRASLSRRARPHCPAGTRPGRCRFCFRRGRRCQAGVQVCYLSGDSLGPTLPRTRVHCPANCGEEMRALPVPAASFLLRCRNLVFVGSAGGAGGNPEPPFKQVAPQTKPLSA